MQKIKTKSHRTPRKVTAIAAIILVIPAIYIFCTWLSIYNGNPDMNESQIASLLANSFEWTGLSGAEINYISMIFCIAAGLLAAISFRQRRVGLRVMMMLTVIAAALIFLMDIVQIL